ncbi:YnjH family protein [Vibrio sp. Of7-15]|uniref:DUF1496 domain-containing protein n=1 Tax=Vibrio sp. Of7-15 TaxID=2724879 RepID=UPI001EF20A8D|nr:DUF1496 domain-containing protein [Vibrio sp. Of7-15]MCG7496648.1 YnjH family protein [Vibrio sp. Of7-15]
MKSKLAVLWLSLAYVCLPAYAQVIKTPDINIGTGSLKNRVCLYDGKAYSLGSILQVGRVYLECVPEKSIEKNGKLMWKQIKD